MVSRSAIGRAAGVLLVLFVAGCASTPEPDDPVTIKLNDLDRRLERIERVISNQSLLELSQQLQAIADRGPLVAWLARGVAVSD